MHRIDTTTAQKDKFGAGKNGFTRGNPQTGVPATDLDDDYFDSIQEELAGLVEGGGLTLDKADRGQVLKALKLLFAANTDSIGALAALVGAANKLPYFTGADEAALADLTAFAREILAQTNAAGVLSKLGLGNAATKDVGTTTGTVAAGDDPRLSAVLGVGQTWQDVTASRASGVNYTNSTGRPIFVQITGRNASAQGRAYVDSVPVGGFTQSSSGTVLSTVSFVVPSGSTYNITSTITVTGGDPMWAELR